MAVKQSFRLGVLGSVFLYTIFSWGAGIELGDTSFEVESNAKIEKTADLGGPTTFSVENSVGNISVEGTNLDQMVLEVVSTGKGSAKVEWTVPESGKMRIKAVYPSGGGSISSSMGISSGGSYINIGGRVFRGGSVSIINGKVIIDGQEVSMTSSSNPSLNFKIKIPKSQLAHIKMETVSGNIKLEDFSGDQDLNRERVVNTKTTSGDVTLARVDALGGISSTTISGNIQASALNVGEQGFQGRTTSGDMTLSKLRGPISVETISGDVRSIVSSEGDISAKTTSGDIQISEHSEGGVRANSISGDIKLNNPSATFEEPRTVSGTIKTNRSERNSARRANVVHSNPFNF